MNFHDERWETVKPIPNIQECHHFLPSNKSELLISKTASSELKRVFAFETLKSVKQENSSPGQSSFYKQIYSSSSESSDTEDTDTDSIQTFLSTKEIKQEEIQPGLFVVVQIHHCHTRKATAEPIGNRYIGICQSQINSEGEVKITFLKSVTGSKYLCKVFKIDDDTSYVNYDDILYSLPYPEIQTKGDRLYYQFEHKIDV